MKITVAGAGGFVGSALTKRLAAVDHEIIAVDIKPLEEWNSYSMGSVETLDETDLTLINNCYWATLNVDYVFNVLSDLSDRASQARIASLAGVNMLDSCCKNNVKGYLNIVNSTAEESYISSYILDRGLNAFSVRTDKIFGVNCPLNADNDIVKLSLAAVEAKKNKQDSISYEFTDDDYSYIYIDDLVEYLVSVIDERAVTPVFLSGSKISVEEIANIVSEASGVNITPHKQDVLFEFDNSLFYTTAHNEVNIKLSVDKVSVIKEIYKSIESQCMIDD